MTKKSCIVCGKEFEAKYSNKKYCSTRCKNKGRDKNNLKEWYEKNKDKLAEKSRRHYLKNKEEVLSRQKEQYKRGKQDFLLKYKIGKSCSNCGYNEHQEILEFHHKNKKDKLIIKACR